MKTYTTAELKDILNKHALWLRGDPSGVRANLSDANLSYSNLYGVDLSYSNLSNADLRGASLSEANLYRANLSGTNLSDDVDLYRANLSNADLRGANLSNADLRGASLYRANLSNANLSNADLRGADLYGADLSYSNLYRANLSDTNLYGAKNLNCPIACPEEGSFIAFKKACNINRTKCYIIKLEIPSDAMRCSATSRKCRCSKAKVISITNIDGTEANANVAYSQYDRKFEYRVGGIIKVDNFDTDRWNECAPGIHFFITRKEAANY